MLTLDDDRQPAELLRGLGARLRALRLQRNLTLAEQARRGGVSVPTLRVLETTGRGATATLARLLYALGREAELEALARPDPPRTLEGLERPRRPRQRASRR